MPDSNQIVGATLQVDTGSSNANIQAVNKNLTDVKAGLKDTGDQAAATGKQVEQSSGSFSNLKEQMGALPGPIGEVGEGASKLGTILKALATNPLVLALTLIVGALTLLYKAFTNTFEGAEKVEQIFAGVKAAAQALFDDLGHIAKAIADFFTFDFSGAADEIKQVVSDVGNAYTAMSKLTQQAQELHRQSLTNDIEAANRQKQLAILREQATDETIPVAKRKAALLELQKASKDAADKDIALSKEVTANKIAQLTLEKDGALKNQDEIAAARIAEIQKETDAANEERRIGKQITQAQKAELAERKAAADKARADAKAARQEQVDYINKLQKIQQDTELAGITDSYAKEAKQLENKIADDKRQNDLAFEDKKITRAQHAAIAAALDQQAAATRGALTDKHNKDLAEKQIAFEVELQAIVAKTREDAQTNTRAAEKAKLQQDHDKSLADAEKKYKDDAIKFQAIKQALDEELRAEQQSLDAKNKAEDDKKKLTVQEQQKKAIISDTKSTLAQKEQALNDEQALVQQAFDNKVITEQEYNSQIATLSQERQRIDQIEAQAKKKLAQDIGTTLTDLAEIVGKQTIAGKALGIATALINTYQGASEAIKQPSTLPSPFDVIAKVASVATIIATGLKTVQSIVSVQVPGSGGGGVSAPAAGGLAAPAAPVAPAQVSTTFNPQQNPTTATASSSRAYVVDADIKNSADRNARLNRAARLGG